MSRPTWGRARLPHQQTGGRRGGGSASPTNKVGRSGRCLGHPLDLRRRSPGPLLVLFLLSLALIATGKPRHLHAADLTFVAAGHRWRYLKGTAEASSPPAAWRATAFDDRAWPLGASGIGYGGGDDATVLSDMPGNYLSVFLRGTFNVLDPATILALRFTMDYDDGFVAYLNGAEIARRGLEGEPVPFDAPSAPHAAGTPETFAVSTSALRRGKNVLAIQVHNESLHSEGLSAIPTLTATPALAATRGPFLQLGGPTTQTVVWQTSAPSDGVLEYGTTPALALSAASSASAITHVVTLTGLSPDTAYHYRVLGSGQVLARDLSFRTFPEAGAHGSFRLAAWGDSGTGDANQSRVAARLVALQPRLAIHTGDLIYEAGEASGFNPRYFLPHGSLIARINVYNTLGNHDVLATNGQAYLDAFYLPSNNPARTERYYSVDHGNLHLVCVDTNQSVAPGSPQHRWLAADLATMGGFWTVVFHHHTPFTVSSAHARDPQNQAIRASFSPLYERHGVDLVVVGHAHCYERTFPVRAEAVVSRSRDDYLDPGAPLYVTTGGGGRDLHTRDPSHANNAFLAVFRADHHAMAFDFAGVTLLAQAVRHDGALLDSFRLVKTPDGAPPVISGVAAVAVGEGGARIIWETDEIADSLVEFGPTAGLGLEAAERLRVTSHAVDLAGLSPGWEYHYRVLSRDRAGNLAASEAASFVTAGEPLDPRTVAYWRWEGNLFDSGPLARHASGEGAKFSLEAPGARVPQTQVANARCLSLDGLSGVSLPDPPAEAGGLSLIDWESATVELFFRAREPLEDEVLLARGPAEGEDLVPGEGLELGLTASGALRFLQVGTAADPQEVNISLTTLEGAVAPGRWHHVAVTLEEGSATLLLDGALLAADTYEPVKATGWAGEIHLGRPRSASGSRGFRGEVDELRISRAPLLTGFLLLTQPEFRLELVPTASVFRSDPFTVALLGTSTLPLLGWSARVKYDPRRAEFLGSTEDAFAGTPWAGAAERLVRLDPQAGEVQVRAHLGSPAEDGPAPLPPQRAALFASLRFRARGCTGEAPFRLEARSPDDLLLEVAAPGPAAEAPVVAGGATLVEPGPTFVRGDVNGAAPLDPGAPASTIDLADVIFLLEFLFRRGPAPPCLEAADVNGNGLLTVGDALHLLRHLFVNAEAAPIPPPWPEAGRAPEPRFSCTNPPPSPCPGGALAAR